MIVDAAPSAEKLAAARALVRGATCWVITDGKAGDEVQCLGVAERLGLTAELRRVNPRAPYVWMMPYGGIDPREAADRPDSPLRGPFPDIAIASGRRAVAYLRALKRLSDGRTLTAFLKDPRVKASTFDFIWVPDHDDLRGANVLSTLVSPHRISPERLEDARRNPPYGLADLATPRVALVVGGNSQNHTFSDTDIARFTENLRQMAVSGVSLMATLSRRTPEKLATAIAGICSEFDGFLWNGQGENPYLALLALADHVIVTADSVNMVGEACATGKPVWLFTPSGGSAKIDRFLRGLEHAGAVRPFSGALSTFTYSPIDATPTIAVTLAERYAMQKKYRK